MAAEEQERKQVEHGLNQIQKDIKSEQQKEARENKLQKDREAREALNDENAFRKAHQRIAKDSEKDRVPLEGLSVLSLPSSNIPSTPNSFLSTSSLSMLAHTIVPPSPSVNHLSSPYGTLLNFSISTLASFSTPISTKSTRHRSTKTSISCTRATRTVPLTFQTDQTPQPPLPACPRPHSRPTFKSGVPAPVQS
ncbi:hypothetical protein CPB83DRAFT_898189 [Crepidotus variabilis]|uniref:Uncharacterized protein n=1 Tax=Crepidotus variabilis TaxID=179855 RepID=A0A9P6E7L4_9AGAR|nr:hypothetical protein CPB83DRAFT_898189 [Crepidotus variabilis]